jgi:hypothetical protein
MLISGIIIKVVGCQQMGNLKNEYRMAGEGVSRHLAESKNVTPQGVHRWNPNSTENGNN